MPWVYSEPQIRIWEAVFSSTMCVRLIGPLPVSYGCHTPRRIFGYIALQYLRPREIAIRLHGWDGALELRLDPASAKGAACTSTMLH